MKPLVCDAGVHVHLNQQYMIMNVDGSEMRQITEEEFLTYQTNISPDRTTIAYTDEVDGSSEIFLVDANGENRRQLTFSAK